MVRTIGCVGNLRRIFPQVVDYSAGSGESVWVAVESEAGKFGDAELFAENAVGVVVLEGPFVNAAFDAAGAVEKRVFGNFKELCGAGEKGFARVEKLEFVAESVFGARA